MDDLFNENLLRERSPMEELSQPMAAILAQCDGRFWNRSSANSTFALDKVIHNPPAEMSEAI